MSPFFGIAVYVNYSEKKFRMSRVFKIYCSVICAETETEHYIRNTAVQKRTLMGSSRTWSPKTPRKGHCKASLTEFVTAVPIENCSNETGMGDTPLSPL